MNLITIIALASFALCLACVALNAVFVLKGKKPIITLAAYGVTFLAFAVTGATAAGLPVPVLSTMNFEKSAELELDPNRFILEMNQLEAEGAVDTRDMVLPYGDLRSVTSDGTGGVEVKATVTLQKQEGMSVLQNFYNVETMVQIHGFEICKEIRYTGVASIKGGGEARVISFTVNQETINALAAHEIGAEDLRDKLESLWIASNLED